MPRAGGEHEVHRQHDLPRDDQRFALGEFVERDADLAADRVLHGTRAASASPERTASNASGTLRAGVRVPRSAAGMVRSACSANVPSGPR